MANISMDPRPTNYLRQNIVFSYPEMIRVSFSLFLCLSVFCYFTLLLIFIKIVLLLLLFFFFFFHENYFYFCMFRDVPVCSGMFRILSTAVNDPVIGRKQKVWCGSNWRFSAFGLTTTKLTGNEFYCYKIEALQFFTLSWTLVTTLTSVLLVEISIHGLLC